MVIMTAKQPGMPELLLLVCPCLDHFFMEQNIICKEILCSCDYCMDVGLTVPLIPPVGDGWTTTEVFLAALEMVAKKK